MNNHEDSTGITTTTTTITNAIHDDSNNNNNGKSQHSTTTGSSNSPNNSIIFRIRHFGSLPKLQQQHQYEDFLLSSSSSSSTLQYKHRGRNTCHQILILIILFLFVVRIQIFNCHVLLKEYNDGINTNTQKQSLQSPLDDRSLILPTPRILVGIFSMNNNDGYMYRQRHRTLFQTWNDTRICSLSEYNLNLQKEVCVFVYTFVIGANPAGTTQLLQVRDDNLTPNNNKNDINNINTTAKSWLVPRTSSTMRNRHRHPNQARDIENPDITLLNIRENMDDGKSQSWIAYSSTVLTATKKDHGQYDFDYIAKWDDGSILLLPEYFHFVSTNLPSQRPYNSMFFVGTPFDKAHWEQSNQTQADHERVESLYENQYNRVHVYVGGQLYIMSIDLAQSITEEAIQHHCSYCEGIEDHDIASIAFHATSRGRTHVESIDHGQTDPTYHDSIDKIDDQSHTPLIKLIFVGRHQQFWEHPVKTNDEWDVIWQREQQRIPVLQQH